jgi:hypothetical protein
MYKYYFILICSKKVKNLQKYQTPIPQITLNIHNLIAYTQNSIKYIHIHIYIRIIYIHIKDLIDLII